MMLCEVRDDKKIKINKKRKSKKRKRGIEVELTQQQKDAKYMQDFQKHVINDDITFTKRVLPFLFGPIDWKSPLCARKMK